jgi:Family of unknown function (DUF6807)
MRQEYDRTAMIRKTACKPSALELSRRKFTWQSSSDRIAVIRREYAAAPMTLSSANNFMRAASLQGLVVAAAQCTVSAGSGKRVTVTVSDDRIDVKVGGAPFTALHTDKGSRKLYLHPLLTASGKRVTRAFPMEQVSGESTDHPHQRGVWIGAEQVSGMDGEGPLPLRTFLAPVAGITNADPSRQVQFSVKFIF